METVLEILCFTILNNEHTQKNPFEWYCFDNEKNGMNLKIKYFN